MKCPYCNQENTRVIDSRPADDNASIRRRRVCEACGRRFTTFEKVETIPLMSYLGLGVQPPDASLGRMLAEGQTYITSSPWCVLGPGLFMIVMVLGVGLLGDGLNERMGGAR